MHSIVNVVVVIVIVIVIVIVTGRQSLVCSPVQSYLHHDILENCQKAQAQRTTRHLQQASITSKDMQ